MIVASKGSVTVQARFGATIYPVGASSQIAHRIRARTTIETTLG
jgi:hypothetical protein